ncbi:hypothetical protein ACIGXM_09910 [Kitasatospora sp. NPDC052896]|uniref:hypothetical protein n=1 Tax=Kitasatospora sp. NPDC052896 TaxID=3364061 RepID=UPI0037C58362
MARLTAEGDRLLVRLAWWERAAARHGDIEVPLTAVDRIAAQPDPWRALRGERESGLLIPGALCLGVWRHPGGRDFFAVRPRRGGVVCVDLRRPAPFARIAVTSAFPEPTVAALRAARSRASTVGSTAEPDRGAGRPEAEPGGAPVTAPVGVSPRPGKHGSGKHATPAAGALA